MLESLIDVDRLRAIGLNAQIVRQLQSLPPQSGESHLMRVTEVHRDALGLHDGECSRVARALPRLHASLREQGDALAVGDWVLAERSAHEQWWVHTRMPPLTQIARRLHDGRDKVARAVIVSNVDTALLVMGLDMDFSLRRLERYLALAQLAGVAALVVLTKADLCADTDRRLREVRSVLPADVPALALNALSEAGRTELLPWLIEGSTLVLLGSSGTGKSTLTNTLIGQPAQLTGEARRGDGRGRHTTSARSLHRTCEGACIIDTPGLRTLRLDSDGGALDNAFDDIARLAASCRFRDCRHDNEPGCAVRDQVAAGRLQNWRKLQREVQRDTLSALQRARQLAQWKARSRQARANPNAKRG
jgi:ribosome biogenesis GTPase